MRLRCHSPRACAYARRSENYSIDTRVGLGLWALPLPLLPPSPPVDILSASHILPFLISKGTTAHSPWDQNDDDEDEDNDDEDNDDEDEDDDDTNCTKLRSEEPIGFQSLFELNEREAWGDEDPCAPESPPSPPPPDPSPPPPSLPPADDIAELLEDEISDADGHHVEQRPSYYEAYESKAQLESDDALWPSEAPQAPIHSPPPPSLLLTDHVSELRKDEILGAGK